MLLGIEIGGTKLQLGVGSGSGGALVDLQREAVRLDDGAEGIRRQIARLAGPMIERHGVTAVGVGFGGPVDARAGRTLVSHQVDGWRDFPLVDWCRKTFNLPAVLGNDSDLAGLGEAKFGAGRGHCVVFYSNVGSGIGGALVVDGRLYSGGSGVASEIGHLRPGPHCDTPEQTVESFASGWAIGSIARELIARELIAQGETSDHAPGAQEAEPYDKNAADDLLRYCAGQADRLTAVTVTEAAEAGNLLAREVLRQACKTYGWAVAQMVTLLAPNAVVIGGGVSLAGEALFLEPLRREVARYVFPPLRKKFTILPAQLGEEVVIHGALALADS